MCIEGLLGNGASRPPDNLLTVCYCFAELASKQKTCFCVRGLTLHRRKPLHYRYVRTNIGDENHDLPADSPYRCGAFPKLEAAMASSVFLGTSYEAATPVETFCTRLAVGVLSKSPPAWVPVVVGPGVGGRRAAQWVSCLKFHSLPYTALTPAISIQTTPMKRAGTGKMAACGSFLG